MKLRTVKQVGFILLTLLSSSCVVVGGYSNKRGWFLWPIESSRVMLNFGVIEQRQARYDEALTQFKVSFQAAKAAQVSDVQIAAVEGIGVVLTAKKDFVGALGVLSESLGLAKQTRSKTREIELLWHLAEVHRESGEYDEAVTYAESAVTLAHSLHLPKLEFLATTTPGQSYAGQNKIDLAAKTLKQAVEQLEMMRDQVAGSELESQLFFENKIAAHHSLVDVLIKQDKPVEALRSSHVQLAAAIKGDA